MDPRLRHTGERGYWAREQGEAKVKFMLLQDYAVEGVEPMSTWPPEDQGPHIEFQAQLNDELRQRGELVEAQALVEVAKTVAHDGVGTPVMTDGPFLESKELLTGYRMADVASPSVRSRSRPRARRRRGRVARRSSRRSRCAR
jgi:hypothetical protein